MKSTDQSVFFTYLKTLFDFSGVKAVIAFSLLVLQGLTQGISILILIPMLQFAGLGSNITGTETPSPLLSFIFQTLGLGRDLVAGLLLYILLIALYELFTYSQTLLNNRIQQGFTVHLRNLLYAAISQAHWLFITRNRSSDIIQALTSDIQRIGTGTYFFLTMLSTGAIVFVHLVLAFILSPAMALTVFFCASILVLVLRPLNLKALQLGQSLHSHSRGMVASITDHLGGIKIAKSFGSEATHVHHFQEYSNKTASEIIDFIRLRAGTSLFNNIGTVICISTLFYSAINFFHIPPVRLFLLVFLFSRILPRISVLHQNYQQIVNMLPAFAAVQAMQQESENAAERISMAPPHPIKLSQGIIIQSVSFHYDASKETFALKDIDLHIPAHQITAIIGPSGAGKTTLADIILGVLTPDKGTVYINDAALTRKNLHDWRRSIGYVPQEAFLFNGSIRDNLLYAKPNATREDIRSALDMASASAFVDPLPHGVDTIIGERGIRLSGGERQRIALARALIRQPELLVLDEATSSLDMANERQIQEAIDRLKGKQTIVVIAHRLSTIRQADQIVVLEKGRVVERGTWNTLTTLKKQMTNPYIATDDTAFSSIAR